MKTILIAAVAAAALTTTASAATTAKVSLHKGDVGTYLVDGSGRTLYLFEKDEHGRSSCSGACAKAWAPLLTRGRPTAGKGVTASRLGTVKRSDGTLQVTYHKHPLYRFSGDRKAGQATGEGVKAFGAEWYVVSAAGSHIEDRSGGGGDTTPTTPTTGSGGYAY
jgi:predicted lipoprotein with Yx(FWY)xxD motif